MFGTIAHAHHHQPERLPQPLEPGDRRLAGRERVALDLHVDEELRQQPDERGPQEHEPDLRGDVREADVLAGGDADADEDDPGARGSGGAAARREVALLDRADGGGRRVDGLVLLSAVGAVAMPPCFPMCRSLHAAGRLEPGGQHGQLGHRDAGGQRGEDARSASATSAGRSIRSADLGRAAAPAAGRAAASRPSPARPRGSARRCRARAPRAPPRARRRAPRPWPPGRPGPERSGQRAGDRADDDREPARRAQRRERRVDEVEDAGQVGGHDGVPARGVELAERAPRDVRARGGHEQVEPVDAGERRAAPRPRR